MSGVLVQFGTSRFLQAHVDLFLHEARASGQDVPDIVVVQTSGAADRAGRVAAFGNPEGFPVIIRGLENGAAVDREVRVRSVRSGLSTAADWDALVRLFVEEATFVVSNTGDRGYAVAGQPGLSADAPDASFPGKLGQLLFQPEQRLVSLLEVADPLKRQLVKDPIRQIALEPARHHHRQKGTAVGGTPAKLAAKARQHLGPGRLELGRHLDYAPGRGMQTGDLLAELRLIGHGPRQIEGAARTADQHLPPSLHLEMAVWFQRHASLLPWILPDFTQRVACCNKVRIYLQKVHFGGGCPALSTTPARPQDPMCFAFLPPRDARAMFCCS